MSADPSGDRTAAPVAWIGGVGAVAGLGAAVARRYARGGLAVAISGRTPERLAAVVESVRSAGGRAHAVPCDLTSEAEVRRAAVAVAALGPLHAAVFNAGNASRGGVLDVSVEAFEQAWRIGTFAAFLFAREAVGALLRGVGDGPAAGGRSLIFTGATASLRGGAKFAAFASAKAGLRSLAQSLARDFGPRQVHVAHVVIDGGIDGERVRRGDPQRLADAGEDGLLSADAIAEAYWQLHGQHRSAWTHELDLRPYRERF